MQATEVLCEADEPVVLEKLEKLQITGAGSKRKSEDKDVVSLEKCAMPWRGKRQHALSGQQAIAFHVDRLTDRHPYAFSFSFSLSFSHTLTDLSRHE
jgi:hypothetical protein